MIKWEKNWNESDLKRSLLIMYVIMHMLLAFALFRHSLSLAMISYAKPEFDVMEYPLLYIIVVMLYATGTDP
jgi:hypothetical protein